MQLGGAETWISALVWGHVHLLAAPRRMRLAETGVREPVTGGAVGPAQLTGYVV